VLGTILGIGALAVTRRKKKRGQQREKWLLTSPIQI
jgi:hypothetical protein